MKSEGTRLLVQQISNLSGSIGFHGRAPEMSGILAFPFLILLWGMNLLISFILSLIFVPLTTSVPTKPIIINADSTTAISTPLQPPLGSNSLSLSVISPSRDDLSIFADQITVAVLVSSPHPTSIDVCLEVNGQWGGCKAVEGGRGDILVDFELEDIPTGEYTAVVGAGEAR